MTKEREPTPAEALLESLRTVRDPSSADSKATSAIIILIEDAPNRDEANYTVRHCGLRIDEVIEMLQVIGDDLLAPEKLH